MRRFFHLKSLTGHGLAYAPARPPETHGILKALGLASVLRSNLFDLRTEDNSDKSRLERLPLKATAGKPAGGIPHEGNPNGTSLPFCFFQILGGIALKTHGEKIEGHGQSHGELRDMLDTYGDCGGITGEQMTAAGFVV